MPDLTKRAIDDLPSVTSRPREMLVLCLGLSRTATMSLHSGLTKLGHKTYHFMEVGQRELPNESHVKCRREAFLAKLYGNGKPYGKPEFDKLLRNYSAVMDAPCACFADELIPAYPKAKVILSNRDPDKWLGSMESSYYRVLTSADFKWFRAVAALDLNFLSPYLDLLHMPLRMWTNDDWENRQKLRATFINHYAHIRDIVPKNNLLEWVPQDGYEPICKFLGVPVPNEPFPNINSGDNAAKIHKTLENIRAPVVLWPYVNLPIFTGFVLLVAWYFASKTIM